MILSSIVGLSCSDGSPITADAEPADALSIDARDWVHDRECPGSLVPCNLSHWHHGFNIWCAAGEVFVDDLTESYYCAPTNLDDEVCTTGGEGDARVVFSCGVPCEETQSMTFELEEDFDPGLYDFEAFCELL